MHILENHVIPLAPQEWHWIWAHGWTGSWIHPCPPQQAGDSVQWCSKSSRIPQICVQRTQSWSYYTQYSGVTNPLECLKYVFNEHNLEATTALNDLRPSMQKQKKVIVTHRLVGECLYAYLGCGLLVGASDNHSPSGGEMPTCTPGWITCQPNKESRYTHNWNALISTDGKNCSSPTYLCWGIVYCSTTQECTSTGLSQQGNGLLVRDEYLTPLLTDKIMRECNTQPPIHHTKYHTLPMHSPCTLYMINSSLVLL